MTNYHIDIQRAVTSKLPISDNDLEQWVILALRDHCPQVELTLRLVDKEEITFLNKTYRNQDKATNVLAFPAHLPDNIDLDYPLLGDVIICPQIMNEESDMLNVPITQHWAHIVIHGVLHLLGYDHIIESDANHMQAIETHLLAELGYDDPYQREVEKLE